jgi:predicted permease
MRARLRAAVRSLTHNPGFSIVAIATLAVCIGSNGAIFSVYDRLVLHPLAIPSPSTLVALWSSNTQAGFFAPAVSWPRYQAVAAGARSFSSTGVSAGDTFTLTAPGEEPIQLNGQRVSGAFFKTLGVLPARGRDFTAEEDVPNGPNVCILSADLWTSRFGGREIVGQTIHLNNDSWQVVGIMPPRLTQPFTQVQVWVPRVFEVAGLTHDQIEAGAGYSQPIARLKAGVRVERAQAELDALTQGYTLENRRRLDGTSLTLARDFTDSIVGTLKPTFYALLGAVAFVLLIACANVASLFVGRLSGRQKEIAVRQSLGATRGAVVTELLTESLLVAAVAGLIGAGLSVSALRGIAILAAQQLPPNTEFDLNWRAWLFLVGVAFLSALLVGLVPALQASKTDIVAVLKDATRGSSGAKGGRLRSSLIVVEVALSVVLLVGSSLLLMSFISLERTPPGFDPTGVATAVVGVPPGRYATGLEQSDFFSRVVDELRRDPTITHAAASLGLPVAGFGIRSPYSVAGRPILPLPERPLAFFQIVSEDYFATLRIPVLRGRAFTASDRDTAPGVCIINEQLANRLFPNASPLGEVLLRGRNAEIRVTVVGVIADLKSNGLNAPVPDEIYYPLRQLPKPALNVTARTSGDPALLQNAIRAAVARVDRDQPISFFQSLDTLLSQTLGIQRIVATLTGCFAAIALVLAAIGLYSVVTYAVAQRRGEIGIRMALGARPGQVLGLIMGGGLKLVAMGLVLGLAGAAGTARLIATLLSNVQPLDPIVYGAVAVFFTIIAAVACFLPSFRASQIDPVVALSASASRCVRK